MRKRKRKRKSINNINIKSTSTSTSTIAARKPEAEADSDSDSDSEPEAAEEASVPPQRLVHPLLPATAAAALSTETFPARLLRVRRYSISTYLHLQRFPERYCG
jgi:acyl dehydratase